MLISLTYSCGKNNSQQIPAMNICDGHPDCENGDDEDPKLCEGDKTIEFYGLTITIGYFSLGCLVFFICKFYLHFKFSFINFLFDRFLG